MPDNRLTLTIEAQNLAQAAFKQLQADVRQSNEALKKTDQTARQSSGGIKVYRDELGRFHDAVTGRYVSAARLLREGFTEVERGAEGAAGAVKQANPVIARMRREYHLLRTDIHNTAAVSRQFATAIQSQIRVQVNAAANLERLRVGLVSITGSIAGAEQQYRRLVEVSRLPGINIENSLKATLQLQALGKSGEEATEVIREFGNALALSGTAPRELNQVINAIRQMSGEGKILQEDIAILTTRVAALVPHLKEAFGGTRAEDVREFFDALGVDSSEQADRFLRIVLDRLVELPRAGETAANAIENLSDTTQRVQATIGANFLPIVKESTAALEGLLMEIEREPQVAKTIAILEGMAGSFLTVTAAGAGLAAALPAIIAAVGSLGAPVLAPIAVLGGLAAAFVGLRIAAEDIETPAERLSEVIEQNAESIRELNRAAADSQNIRRLRQAQEELIEDQQSLQEELKQTKTDLVEAQEVLNNYILQRRTFDQGTDVILGPELAPLTPLEDVNTNTAQFQNLQTQIIILAKSFAELQEQVLEFESAGSKISGALDPLVEAQVNVDNLTKSIADLKEELQEEVVFEGVSRGILGEDVDFRKSATALVDIQTLIKLNADAFEELGKAAASGNQEAIDALDKLNTSLNNLRNTQAERHLDNLSLAFENLQQSGDATRRQYEDILRSAQGFVKAFQDGPDVLQDDVTRAQELISNLRSQLQALGSDETTLELHDEGAEALTKALTDFYDLQRDVQEAVKLDAERSAEQQATAYIKAYRDTIDPAILHLVESVKLLRTEVRGSIQDLEVLNQQDQFTLDVRGEIGSEQSDALAELFDLQQAVQDGIRKNEIDNLRNRSLALRDKLSDDTLSLQRYKADVISILRAIYDAEVSFQVVDVRETQNQRQAENARKLTQTILALEDATSEHQVESIIRTTQERQRVLDGSVGALKVIYDRFVQLEQDAQSKLAVLISGGEVAQAREKLTRLEERALDALSQRERETLIRGTQQFVDAYRERGEAFRDLVADAQDLGDELQEAFDLTEQAKRLEDFRDSVANVIEDLAGITIDHFWDSFTDGASAATDAVSTFVDVVRGELSLLQSDITRLTRFDEDQDIRRQRLIEDSDRRIRQLERQRRSIASRQQPGDQRAIERNVQRQQDLTARIASLRGDFGVRLSRFDEDRDRRRSRTIEDALQRRERFESRGSDEGLISKLVDSLAGSLSSTLSDAIGNALTGVLGGLLGSQFTNLLDGLKGLFGSGSGDGQGDGDTSGTTDLDGTLTIPKESIKLPEGALDLTGKIILALTDITAPTEAVDLRGRISEIEDLSDDVRKPPVPGLKGGLIDIVLQQNAQKPIVPGLIGQIGALELADAIEDLPNAAGLEGRIDALTLLDVDGGLTLPTVAGLQGQIDSVTLSSAASTGLSVALAGIINSLKVEGTLPSVEGLTGTIDSLVLATGEDAPSPPSVNIAGVVNSLAVSATTPALAGLNGTISNVVMSPDIDLPSITGLSGRIDSVILAPDVDLPTIRIPATAVVGPVTGGERIGTILGETEEDPENPILGGGDIAGEINASLVKTFTEPVPIAGEIRATLKKLFDEPIVLQGRIDATVNYLTGANIDQEDDVNRRGGGERPAGRNEEPVQRSQVAADLSTIARVLEGAAVSGNLNPELGPTPRVDIPTPNLDTENQPVPGASHPQGFGDALRNENQFAPRAGGGGRAGGPTGALRVTFPTEVLSKLAQEETLSKHFVGANQHLAIIRTFIANEMFPAIDRHLATIATNTQILTEIPIVEALAAPSAPGLDEAPIGLGNESLDILNTLVNLRDLAGPTPNLAAGFGDSASNPLFASIVNQKDVQKVEIVKGQVDANVTNDKLKVEQVGTVQVTQSGEWVMQLSNGQTVPVYVEGGRLVADIEGGLEGLATSLADTEVGLRAVGAI